MILFIALILVIQLLYMLCAISSPRILPQLAIFLASIATAEFSKRFLYAFHDVPHFYYYLMLVPPDCIFAIMAIRQKGRFYLSKTYIAAGILIVVLSLLQNPADGVALNIKTEYIYTILIMAPAVFWSITDADLRLFRRALYPLAVTASIYGVYQFVFGYSSWEINWFNTSPSEMSLWGFTNGGTIYRAFSFFSGLHEFALFLCFTGAFIGFTCSRSRVIKVLALFPLALGLLASNAKGVYVAVLIAGALVLLGSRLSAIRMMLIVLAPVTFFFLASEFAILGAVDFVGAHFGSLAQYISPETTLPRLMVIMGHIDQLNPHSLNFYFGSGIGFEVTAHGTAMLLDNNYLEIFLEFGMVGLLCFLGLIYWIYREYFWLIRNGKLERSERGILNAAFFYITTVLFDLYGSLDFTTRGILVCFLASCMLIHSKYRRRLNCPEAAIQTQVMRSSHA